MRLESRPAHRLLIPRGVALAAMLALFAMPALAEKGGKGGKGGGKPEDAGGGKPADAGSQGKGAEKHGAKPAETGSDDMSSEGHDPKGKDRVDTGHAFGREQGEVIRAWFADPRNLSGLPPGLAKRDTLPPGLARQVDRNGKLPPGLEKKLHPLPEDLERRLPKLPSGFHRAVLGDDVLLIDDNAGRVRDILNRVLAN